MNIKSVLLNWKWKLRIRKLLDESELALLRKHFDSKFYLACNPDVAGLDVEPIFHYILNGERENRSPLRGFFPEQFSQSYLYGAKVPSVFWVYIKYCDEQKKIAAGLVDKINSAEEKTHNNKLHFSWFK